jgi:hypothetical protein
MCGVHSSAAVLPTLADLCATCLQPLPSFFSCLTCYFFKRSSKAFTLSFLNESRLDPHPLHTRSPAPTMAGSLMAMAAAQRCPAQSTAGECQSPPCHVLKRMALCGYGLETVSLQR